LHSSSPGQNALFLQMEIFLRDKGVQNSVRLGRQTGRARRIRTPPMVSAFSHCDKEFWDCDSCIGSRTSGVSKSGRVNAPGGAAVLGLPCPNEMGGTRFDITCSPIRMFSSRKLVAVFLTVRLGVVRLGFVSDRAWKLACQVAQPQSHQISPESDTVT
jgi:hypothetical protein